MDPTPQALGDSPSCPLAPVTVQSRLERGPAGQVRTEQAAPVSTGNSVLYGHTEGNWRLCRSNEDGSSGIWSWAGAQALSVGMQESLIQEICMELGLVKVTP